MNYQSRSSLQIKVTKLIQVAYWPALFCLWCFDGGRHSLASDWLHCLPSKRERSCLCETTLSVSNYLTSLILKATFLDQKWLAVGVYVLWGMAGGRTEVQPVRDTVFTDSGMQGLSRCWLWFCIECFNWLIWLFFFCPFFSSSFSSSIVRADTTFAVGWALKTNYLSIVCSSSFVYHSNVCILKCFLGY